jgi:hypothetical protein
MSDCQFQDLGEEQTIWSDDGQLPNASSPWPLGPGWREIHRLYRWYLGWYWSCHVPNPWFSDGSGFWTIPGGALFRSTMCDVGFWKLGMPGALIPGRGCWVHRLVAKLQQHDLRCAWTYYFISIIRCTTTCTRINGCGSKFCIGLEPPSISENVGSTTRNFNKRFLVGGCVYPCKWDDFSEALAGW